MLRILHIIPRLNKGGAERLCLDICNHLAEKDGVQVRLVTFSGENAYPELTKNIDWQVVPARIQLSLHHPNRLQVEALQQTIEDFAPDVIHTHLFEAEIVSRSCDYPQAKWFSHCHDNMKQFRNFSFNTLVNKEWLTNYYEKKYLLSRYKANGGTAFLAISHDTEQYFRSTQPYSVAILPNAIDYNKFYTSEERNCQTKLKLINVGTFNKNKNQIFLVQLAQILHNRNVDFDLDLLGSGPDFDYIRQVVEKNKLTQYVHLYGRVDNVENYLWKSFIYVHSSLSEALGLTLLEAMAAGLPVITLDGRGNRDLMVQGKNGYMVYEQDAEQFADRILEIWNNHQQYKEMSAFAQNFARQYDIKEYVDKLIELYKPV